MRYACELKQSLDTPGGQISVWRSLVVRHGIEIRVEVVVGGIPGTEQVLEDVDVAALEPHELILLFGIEGAWVAAAAVQHLREAWVRTEHRVYLVGELDSRVRWRGAASAAQGSQLEGCNR